MACRALLPWTTRHASAKGAAVARHPHTAAVGMTRHHAAGETRGVALQDPLVCPTRHTPPPAGGVARGAHTVGRPTTPIGWARAAGAPRARAAGRTGPGRLGPGGPT